MKKYSITLDEIYDNIFDFSNLKASDLITSLGVNLEDIQDDYFTSLIELFEDIGQKEEFIIYALGDIVSENDDIAEMIFDYLMINNIVTINNSNRYTIDMLATELEEMFEVEIECRQAELRDLNNWWYMTR